MGGVELLFVGVVVVHNAQCGYVVDDAAVLSVVEVTATVIASIAGAGGRGGIKPDLMVNVHVSQWLRY